MRLPDGPHAHPLLQSWHWIWHPFEFLEECLARYGEVFRIELMNFRRVVILANPDVIKEIFAGDPEDFPAGPSNAVVKPFLGENSMLVIDGAEHVRQRKLIMPALHGERMELYGRTMLELTDDSIDTWPLHDLFSMHEMLQHITLQVILRTIFGFAEGARFAQVHEVVRSGLAIATHPLLLFPFLQRDVGAWSPWGRVRRFMQRLDAILLEEVQTRQAEQARGEAGRNDILSLLVAARDDEGQPMTFKELRDELMTMLVAGHETTATALGWTLCGLLRDAPLGRRLRDEIGSAVESGQLVPQRVAKLPLLEATVREGLRYRPVIPIIGRQLRRPMRIGGFDIPAGWNVSPSIYLAHHRPSVFPNPNRFDPERFLRARPAPSEWFPFGGGHRRCIGAAFAMYEMKMILAAILLRADLSLKPGYAPRVARRSITLVPSQGVPMLLYERRPRARALPT